jgi:hypothetical protein
MDIDNLLKRGKENEIRTVLRKIILSIHMVMCENVTTLFRIEFISKRGCKECDEGWTLKF